LQEHRGSLIADLKIRDGELPAYVIDMLEACLRCGIKFAAFFACVARTAFAAES
jgi:hypothetical protein